MRNDFVALIQQHCNIKTCRKSIHKGKKDIKHKIDRSTFVLLNSICSVFFEAKISLHNIKGHFLSLTLTIKLTLTFVLSLLNLIFIR